MASGFTREQYAKIGMNEEMIDWQMQTAEIAEKLVAEGHDFVTATVMANDRLSAERRRVMLDAGEITAERAVNLTGSYARLGFALELVGEGRLTRDWLLDELPELWRGSDPDDTDPQFLALWQEASRRNRGAVITDGQPLPRRQALIVYRGQGDGDSYGIAWTLDPAIARKFAVTRGGRSLVPGGSVITGLVGRDDVLAYLTGRGESEVIVDPVHVR